MRYLLLIHSDETMIASMSENEMQVAMGPWNAYTEELQEKGKMLGGEILELTATAKTVRLGEGGFTSDGPFAETKEQLGGFYMIEADSIEEAAEWAAKIPNIPEGSSVEVRPIVDMPQQ